MRRTAAVALAVASLCGFGTLLAADAAPLVNASFESPGDLPEGWTLAVGAKTGDGPESVVAVDRTVAREGKASLRLSGDASTTVWRMVAQDVAFRPGDRVTVRVAAKCRGLDASSAKYRNANAVLVFETASGQRAQILGSPLLAGDHDWTDLVIDAIAPPAAAKARVGLLLSIPGTAWFDDVRVESGPATADDAAGRARAFDALAGHLRRTYPFFGFAGKPEADALFARHRAKCAAAKDAVGFLNEIHAMLAELNDVHVNVETAQRRLPTAQPDPRPLNMNLVAVAGALTERTAYEKNVVLAGRIGKGPDAVGYVAVGTFQLDEAGFAKVAAAIDALADTKALILDVRSNLGGEEMLGARIAGRFTKEPVVYAREVYRDPLAASTGAFTPPEDRTLRPVAPYDGRRVAVLQGPCCVSSTEGFLAMMRALPNVTTIGQTSRGASGNPAPFEMIPGVKIWTSRWRSLTPDGACIEGKGLAPKVVVDAPHDKSDPTLERALAELR
jgi:hypothetical protein